jgi:uncharacterized protein (TIGR02453 family)
MTKDRDFLPLPRDAHPAAGLHRARGPATVPGMPTPAAARFTGFDKAAMQFWHELAAEMNREWFTAHKERYEALWVAPMTALLGEIARGLAPAYRPLTLGEPKVLRIYRDVRFSRDKAPYKTHIGAAITVAGKAVGEGGNTAMYLHVGLDEEFVGVGCYRFDAGKLAAWRKAVAGKPGEALAPMVARLRKAGYEVGGHDDYKKVPTGFAADHPRAEFLKMKGLTAGCGEIPRGLIHKPGFAAWLVKHGKAMAPLVIWLHRHVP